MHQLLSLASRGEIANVANCLQYREIGVRMRNVAALHPIDEQYYPPRTRSTDKILTSFLLVKEAYESVWDIYLADEIRLDDIKHLANTQSHTEIDQYYISICHRRREYIDDLQNDKCWLIKVERHLLNCGYSKVELGNIDWCLDPRYNVSFINNRPIYVYAPN